MDGTFLLKCMECKKIVHSNGSWAKVFNADCFDVFPAIKDQSIDLILVDTPYATTKNKWDTLLDLDLMFQESYRVIKKGCAIIHFAQDKYTAQLIMSQFKNYKHRWVWDKVSSANFAVAKHMPLTVTEDVLIFSEDDLIDNTPNDDILVFTNDGSKVDYFPKMMKGKLRFRGSKNAKSNGEGFGGVNQVYYQSDEYYPTNLLKFSVVPRRQSLHPSQKPVDLLKYLIETYSVNGSTILDFTMGVGSIGVACKHTNRNFIGIEKEQIYYDIAVERIETE